MANATLAIAAGVTFADYWIFAYGFSQLRGCNAGFIAMGMPFGALPVCNSDSGDQDLPPKTPKDTGKTGGSPPKPCTAKQLKQGMTNDINGNCMPKATGSYKCVSGDGDVIYVSGSQCPKGYSHPSIWNLWDSLRF